MEGNWTENAFESPASSSASTQHATLPTAQPEAHPPAPPARSPPLSPLIADCAVSIYGWAMPIPDGVYRHGLSTLYCELPPNRVPWKQAANEMLRQGKWPWRDSFRPTAEEHNPFRGWAGRALVVGFALTGLESMHYEPAPSIDRFRFGGDEMGPGGIWAGTPTLVPYLQAKRVVMVVAKLEHSLQKGTLLYALLRSSNPTSGLCIPYRIRSEECFYLPRFRVFAEPNKNGHKGRLMSWNINVRTACVIPLDMPLDVEFPVDGRPQASQEGGERDEVREEKEVLEAMYTEEAGVVPRTKETEELPDPWTLPPYPR